MLGERCRRQFLCAVILSLFVLSLSLSAAGSDSPFYFVEISLTDRDLVRPLAEAGFDVAGYDRTTSMAGIVATAEDLALLEALGYTFEVRDVSHPLRSRGEALADYTDAIEMEAFLAEMEAVYPHLVKVTPLQESLFEGRRQFLVKITADVDEPNDRPSFHLDAQHHAREVMTPEIARDMIEYLATRYDTDDQVKHWLDSINVYVIPSVNPDGAMYIFDHDNMWRKNRNPQCGPGDLTGIDLNRNYPFNWSACSGSSGDCTSLVYHGTAASSEPEVQAVQWVLDQTRPIFAVTYHAYGEYIVVPYGCTAYDQYSNELALSLEIGAGLVEVLPDDDGRIRSFDIGPGYQNGGMAQDTYYSKYGVFPYLIEVGRSFQPDYASLRDVTVERQRAAWMYFLDQTLEAPQIRGKVTDSVTGDPLPCEIRLQEITFTNGEAVRRADDRGVYGRLVAAGGTYHLTYSYPGYCSASRAVTVGENPVDLNVALAPTGFEPLGSPSPADGFMSVVPGATLSWNGNGGPYEVYFGTTSDPPQRGTASANTFDPGPLELGRTYYWRVAETASCGPASGPVWSFKTIPCSINRVVKRGGPFRLKVKGEGFRSGYVIRIDGVPAPRTQFKNGQTLVAKGGNTLKAMVPRGQTVLITVEDPRGGISEAFEFQR